MVPSLSLHLVQLPSGETVKVRPLRSGDALLLQELHQRVSPTTLYYRYLRPYQPTLAELAQICRLGKGEGAGIIALMEGPPIQAIGFAHYHIDRQQPTTAEVGFLVEDRFQGQGVGRTLFQQLVQRAQAQGLQTFTAYVHPTNHAMLRVFQRSGLPLTMNFVDGLHAVRITLRPALKGQSTVSRHAVALLRRRFARHPGDKVGV
ncbi:MAG: GNAT family protein [Caldilineaceae bacterium]